MYCVSIEDLGHFLSFIKTDFTENLPIPSTAEIRCKRPLLYTPMEWALQLRAVGDTVRLSIDICPIS